MIKDKLKEIRTRLGKPVAALLDTKGPEIRIREFENEKVTLKEGQEFTLTAEEIMGNEKIVSVTYKELYKDVKPGNSILIDDGLDGNLVIFLCIRIQLRIAVIDAVDRLGQKNAVCIHLNRTQRYAGIR